MATLKPLRGWTPRGDIAAELCSRPYDVMNTDEARAEIAAHPNSFLRVTRSEALLSPDVNPYSDAVYSRAREEWLRLHDEGLLRRNETPCYYLYRLTWKGRVQTGLVALASVAEYRAGAVKRHELTRPDKEDDRTRHIATTGAQTGPVFLAWRREPELERLIAGETNHPPIIAFTTDDGITHELWRAADTDAIAAAASGIAALYICDGHHRTASAARAAESAGNDGGFLSVSFPAGELRILPYHRVVHDLNGMNAAALRERIHAVTDPVGNDTSPEQVFSGSFAFYLDGRWETRQFRLKGARDADPVRRLDASRLQEDILSPILGIADVRTSPRIHFVGGIHGAGELGRQVDRGEGAIAFAMPAVTMEELFAVADAGLLMPPKSTWFEPKLRDGLIVAGEGRDLGG